MSIVAKNHPPTETKQFGAKVSKKVLNQLKAYSRYVGQPLNYCTDQLLHFALENDAEFQVYLKSSQKPQHSKKSGWDLLLEMGENAHLSEVTDISKNHDRYLYELYELEGKR